jgi:hypothetical protein
VAVLRESIDMLVTQSHMDAGPALECVGACKVALFKLEQRRRELDRQAARGEPMPQEVLLAAAGRRV